MSDVLYLVSLVELHISSLCIALHTLQEHVLSFCFNTLFVLPWTRVSARFYMPQLEVFGTLLSSCQIYVIQAGASELSYGCLKYFCIVALMTLYTIIVGNDVTSFNLSATWQEVMRHHH